MDNRVKILLAILKSVAAQYEGSTDVQEAIEALIKRDADPTNDVDEVVNAVAQLIVGGVALVEDITNKDYVNNIALVELVENLKRDIKLIRELLVKQAE